MRRARRDDDDVAGFDDQLAVADRERGGPRVHDEHLGVGVQMQRRALAAPVLGDEDRGRDLVATFEQRSRRAAPQVVDRDHSVHMRKA